MGKYTSLKPADLKNENKASVLQFMYRHGLTTKLEISKVLNLSKPTVSALVDELVQEGLLKEEGLGQSTTSGGKRPKLFAFHPKARIVVALSIGVESIEGALVDLEVNVLHVQKQPTPQTDMTFCLQTIRSIVQNLLDLAAQWGIPVLGIGVSAPGVVESRKGVIVNSAHLAGWHEVPLSSELEAQFGLPVWLDNESRNVALAEKWFGLGQGLDTFVSIQTKDGIGAGFIINGMIHRGIDNSGGEFGHTTIDLHGPACRCGNRGCWELYAMENAFLQRFEQALLTQAATLPELELSQLDAIDMELAGRLYASGVAFAREEVAAYALYLGIGIVNMVNVFNPEMVILHGDILHLGEPFLQEVETIVRKRALLPSAERVRIRFSKFGRNARIIGAAALVIMDAIDGSLLLSNQF